MRLVVGILCVAVTSACGAHDSVTRRDARPAERSIAVRDGFEGDSLAPFWLPGDHGSGRSAPGAVVPSHDHARSGHRSARITLRKGDVAQRGDSGQANERAELDSGKRPLMNQDVWCGFSFLVPAGFPIVDVRLVLSQWKQSGLEGSPIVAQRFQAGRHYLTIRDVETRGEWRGVFELPPIVQGAWHDIVVHVRFAKDSSGVVEAWMDGKRVASLSGTTASPNGADTFYPKVGLYRDTMDQPMTLYIDNYAVGDDFEAVDPARW